LLFRSCGIGATRVILLADRSRAYVKFSDHGMAFEAIRAFNHMVIWGDEIFVQAIPASRVTFDNNDLVVDIAQPVGAGAPVAGAVDGGAPVAGAVDGGAPVAGAVDGGAPVAGAP